MFKKLVLLSVLCIFGIYGQKHTTDDDGSTTSISQTSETELSSITISELTSTTLEVTTPEVTTTSEAVTSEATTTSSPEPITTTPKPITTPKPTPIPTPESPKVTYDVHDKDSNKTVCIRLKAGIQLDIEGKNLVNFNPNTTEVSKDSTCSDSENNQILILNDEGYSLTILFATDNKSAIARNVSLTVPGVPDTFESSSPYFSVKLHNSYLCKEKSEVKLNENTTVRFYDLQLQAFMHGEKGFSEAEECAADNPDDKMSNVVPIAVAIALLSLVVLILIGYLITRRRNQKKQYQSM